MLEAAFQRDFLQMFDVDIPGPVAGLKVLTVDETSGARLQERSSEHTDVVEAALGGVRVVAELLGTTELCLLGPHTCLYIWSEGGRYFILFTQYTATVNPESRDSLEIRSTNFKCQNIKFIQ